MRLRRLSTGLCNIFVFLLLTLVFSLTACGSTNKTKTDISQSASLEQTDEQPESEPEPPPEPVVKTALINFTGDLMVHSYQYEESYDSDSGTYEFDHNFAAVKKYFDKADYTVGNLETVLGGDEIGPRDFPCFNTPDSFAYAAKDAGFDFLTTANNHCADQGTQALCRTLDIQIGRAHV